MIYTATAMEEGRLTSLMPMRKGKLIVTRGRLGERSLNPIFGVTELPILMPESRVAELFMWRAHNGYLLHLLEVVLPLQLFHAVHLKVLN